MKYPNVKVQLTGTDGNAFVVLGKVLGAMRKAGISDEERSKFKHEATKSDYDHLLATCMDWVDVN